MKFRKLCLAALFVTLFALTAHADPITLTGGQVLMQDPCNDPFGSVNLTGTDGFAVVGRGAQRGCVLGDGFTFGFEHGGFGSQLSYQGQDYTFFRGDLFFNSSSITGTVTAYGTHFFSDPLITLTFSGTGFRADRPSSLGGTLYVFNVNTPTPEPASALLLLTGVTAAAGFVRRRRKGKAS